MSRTISTTIQTAIGENVVTPGYLVYVGLDTPLRWSTVGDVTWDGVDWLAVGMTVDRLAESETRIRIRNDDNSGSSLALNNRLRDTEFRIYAYYDGDALEVFKGYGGEASITAFDVVITLHSNRSAKAKVPRGRIAAPTFTNLPKLGAVIEWGEERLKVEF